MNREIYQGPGILTTLYAIVCILKLCGIITWSWWIILAPLWIPPLITAVVMVIIGIALLVRVYEYEK